MSEVAETDYLIETGLWSLIQEEEAAQLAKSLETEAGISMFNLARGFDPNSETHDPDYRLAMPLWRYRISDPSALLIGFNHAFDRLGVPWVGVEGFDQYSKTPRRLGELGVEHYSDAMHGLATRLGILIQAGSHALTPEARLAQRNIRARLFRLSLVSHDTSDLALAA